MKNEELRALRQELGLQVEWCAERVGHVSARSWKFWESGREGRETPVPLDVQVRMHALAKAIPKALATKATVVQKPDESA